MAKKQKKKRKLRVGRVILLFVILLAIILGIFSLKYSKAQKPVSSKDEEVVFTVESGLSSKAVLQSLKNEGLIRDSSLGYLYAKNNHLTNIKAGDYTLNKNMDLKTILTTINDASKAISYDVSVTVVEGDWAKHIADKISAVTNVSSDELLSLWNSEDYIRSIMDKYPFLTDEIFNDNIRIKLEGYLAPNTYNFFEETTAEDVTEKILNETLSIYNKYEKEINKSSLSIHEIYTLASIVQYESGKIDDMKKIAEVFYNRMKIGMPLQSSVTVCYALDINKNDNWMACEVNPNYDSLYNTYKYPGLPPGPIQNPGEDAINAVLNPDSNDYLYFMADVYGDGTVYYAKTYAEHEANVNRFLK